jgi:hypothetical protein
MLGVEVGSAAKARYHALRVAYRPVRRVRNPERPGWLLVVT